MHLLDKPKAVLVVDETVVEDAHGLVHPQAHEHALGLHLALLDQTAAEYDAREVAQVEYVVGLCGRGQQIGGGLLVNVERGLDDVVADGEVVGGVLLLLEVGADEGGEDARHRLVVELVDGDEIEVAREASRDRIAAAARRSHGRDELNVLEDEAARVLAIVPVAVVHVHAEELDGRLSAVLLALRHVHVVHEEDRLAHHGRTEDALAPLVQARHEYVLHLVGARLRREVDEKGHVLVLGQTVHQIVLNVGALARARRTDEQHRSLVAHAVLEYVRVAHRVHGGHDHRADVARLLGALVARCRRAQQVVPVAPLAAVFHLHVCT